MKILNQIKKQKTDFVVSIDLEVALMQFISMFKSSVIGDPRIILLGSTAFEESVG